MINALIPVKTSLPSVDSSELKIARITGRQFIAIFTWTHVRSPIKQLINNYFHFHRETRKLVRRKKRGIGGTGLISSSGTNMVKGV